MRESDLLPPITEYLDHSGLTPYYEVPFETRRIDVVGWGSGRLVCIELKVHDWRRAIVQASICQLCTPEVYVALPYPLARKVDQQPFREFGIGLLAVDGTTEVIVEPIDLGLTDLKVRKYLEQGLGNNHLSVQTQFPGRPEK